MDPDAIEELDRRIQYKTKVNPQSISEGDLPAIVFASQ
jgi:hypothetical protein